MKRRAPANPPAERRNEAGEPVVAISTAEKRNFARACLITWTQRDGRDRGWMIRANSIDVPADIVAETRDRLARDRAFARRAEQEGIDA